MKYSNIIDVKRRINKNLSLSVIIPVYNAEKFIERCLNSILYQKNIKFEFEIICINDGSIDNSLNVLNDYYERFDKIVIIDAYNKGAGTARNIGIEYALGEYIWFVDADDFIEENAFEYIYKESINNEYSIGFRFNRYDSINGKVIANFGNVETKVYNGLEYPLNIKYYYLWLLILKRSVIIENNIRFIDGIKNIEDFEFMITYFTYHKPMKFIDIVLYNYNNDNDQSTSRLRSKDNLKKLADDSVIVHDSLSIKSKNNNDIVYFLNMSIIGFFNSLRLLYTKKDFIFYYKYYLSKNYLPLQIFPSYNIKFKIFAFILNNIRFFIKNKR